MDNREATTGAALDRLVRGIAGGLYFCRPGYIEKFDAENQLAEVTPAVMLKYSADDSVEYRKMPKLINVPVVVPFVQTLGLALTLPIRPGDECLLVFADRFIDDFIENGAQSGCAKPEAKGGRNSNTEPRAHHLTDAICIPGIVTQPQILPDWNTEAVEIRNRPRTAYISLRPDGDIAIRTVGNIAIRADGDIDIEAGGDLVEKGGKILLN